MDRSEAYRILTLEMQKLADLSVDQLVARCENVVEVDCHGASGKLYRLALGVEQKTPERFVVTGKIHDNNSYRFSLLEESLELNVSAKD